jgi:hypothetical protein
MTVTDWFFRLRSSIASTIIDASDITPETARDIAESIMSSLNYEGLLVVPAQFDERYVEADQ